MFICLKDSLLGEAKSTLICTLSNKFTNESDTINTLKFAKRTKKIK